MFRFAHRAAVRILIALVALAACGAPVPVRIAAPGDTVTMNTTLIEALDAHVVDARGVQVPRATITYSASPDSIVAVYDRGGIQCRKDGVTTVTVASGALSARVPVRCHIIEHIAMDNTYTCLRVGDAPTPLPLYAFDAEGKPISQIRVSMRTSDTTVFRYVDGRIIPLAPGEGDIGASTGRRGAFKWIRVFDSTDHTPRDSACAMAERARFAPKPLVGADSAAR